MNLSLVLYIENNIEILVIRKCLDKRLLNCKSRCKSFDNGSITVLREKKSNISSPTY